MKEITERKNSPLGQFIIWFMFTSSILGVSILTSYEPLWANIPFNIIPGILVLIFLKPVFFEKLKLSTLILMRTFIVFAALGIVSGDFYVKICLVFLIINILEATFTDFKHKQYYNFITGLVLAASVLLLKGTWMGGIYAADAASNMATIAWFIAYTLWNWIFVTGEFSASIALMHVGFLLAPIAGTIITKTPGFWLIFRANTLTFGGILQIANKEFFEDAFENKGFADFVEKTQKKSLQLAFMIFNLALLAYTLYVAYF